MNADGTSVIEGLGGKNVLPVFRRFSMCSKVTEIWHVDFILVKKHCSVFFSLISSSFSRNNVAKTQVSPVGDLCLWRNKRNLTHLTQ